MRENEAVVSYGGIFMDENNRTTKLDCINRVYVRNQNALTHTLTLNINAHVRMNLLPFLRRVRNK